MEKEDNIIKDKDFIVELMMSTRKEDLNYVYRGEFNQSLSQHILSLAEKNIDKERISIKIKKRVFHIMVESIQNITRHKDGSEDEELKDDEFSIFSIQKQKEWYYITTGNIVEDVKLGPLCEKLDRINNLDQAELTQFYKEVLSNGKLSSKGGAGLGLIEMARKSGNKLSYEVKKLRDDISYFYMHSNINTLTLDEAPILPEDSIYSLRYIVKLHQFIIENDILLIYSTIFDQESLISLISIINSRPLDRLSFKKKLVSLMVEMLQNIIHHGRVHFGDIDGSQGIFYINVKNEEYRLNSVNYVKNEAIDKIKSKIDHINSLDEESLETFYNERLFDFKIITEKEAGLGFIEMRIKSRNPIGYSFKKINEEYSLFKLTLFLDN